MKKILAIALAVLMIVSVMPFAVLASEFDTSVSDDYFKVISEDKYALAPGASETELIINNAEGTDRKVVHYFEVDTKNENIDVLPGYYGIDKLDPDNLALDGIVDKKEFWKAEQLTKTVAYYENMGYNVVGAMNTALAYDSDAPYGYMVWNGVVLGSPEVHKGAQTYLAIDAEGNCELRSMTTPLDGSEVTAISANFGWLVKDGQLTSKTVERTSSDASRSMIGIKADGTLIFCQVDGRNAPVSTGLSNYEMGEMMLSLGCVNAVNCDGGGSSTFVSKREGESENVMRSIPSDGSERATINSVIIVSKAKATGEFDHAVLDTEYDYYAPTTSAAIIAKGVDAAGSPADIPVDAISWALSDDSFGTVADGVFTSNGKKGDVTVKMIYNDEVVGEKLIHVVDPEVFALALDETVLPYGKEMIIDFASTYGADNWAVCVDGAVEFTLSDATAATLNGNVFKATTDESITGVDVTATYIPNPEVTDVLKVTFGKGSEVVLDFEDGDISNFLGMDEMYDWAEKVGASAPIQSNGNYSDDADSETFLSTDIVRNGKYALGVTLDYTDAQFAEWSYNMFFYVGEPIVLRDVANGKNATTFGMWVYIPEGGAGLAMQIQGFKNPDGTGGTGAHFYFTTVSGVKKNLNSCTEADIPESRWVYATVDLTSFGDFFATYDPFGTNGREPSFIRYYVKPTTAAKLTFYFDDFTLDYSSAVDDRVLPTITETAYTTQDESVALANGAVINGNNVSFSAVVADNMKLDNATGKIYVDGVELSNVSVSGKYLITDTPVALASGVHTVKFEIKDTLGNTAAVYRTFTIVGDAAVTLGGHNDSGLMPEYDSIYYVDINVADLANVNKVTTELKLQSANTWEPQGMVIANGFKATYSVNLPENVLTLVVERIGDTLAASTDETLVSIPVRLWSWNGVNHVTDTPVTPAAHYKTGNCPIVTVDCKVVMGEVEYANGETNSFGGSISVATKINDTVYAWHVHDAELVALADVEATCTTNGYYGRTYCKGCASVIDWGTIVEATGHDYTVVNGNAVCGNCGDTKVTTGLVEIEGNTYYFINGKAATDWQMIGTDWYYFDLTTAVGANGDVKIGEITFNFVDGKLTSGVWVKTVYGNRYYYGPDYYHSRDGLWVTIDGKEYFFDSNGMRMVSGYQNIWENQINAIWYYFEEDGSCDRSVKIPDGFYTDRNGFGYSKDGKGLSGLHCIDGEYYYFNNKGYALNDSTYAGRLFKEDYAAYTGVVEIDETLYFYQNGLTGTCGLFYVDGNYYYVYWGGIIKTSGSYYVSRTYCDLPVGTYEFGEDGKMLNGIVEKDGVQYLYANGKLASYGLYKIEDAYYFASNKGVFQTGGRYYVSTTHCDLPAGNYTFGEDGKMLDGIVAVDGQLYLYNNGTTETCGLFDVDGKYYYVYWGGVIQTNGRYYVTRTYCDLPVGNYTFGADGAMLDGVVEVDGQLYLYNKGTTETCGLFEIDGKYYYSYWGGVIQTNGRYYVTRTYCDLPVGNYTFGADGAMLNGVVDIDGTLYLYENGSTQTCGLFEIDGEYYYSYWGGIVKTSGRYYVSRIYCDLSAGNYTFDADGKMLNGFVTKDDGIYYYENGNTPAPKMIFVDGYYYYVSWGGKLLTNGTYYVSADGVYNEISIKGTFNELGQLIK